MLLNRFETALTNNPLRAAVQRFFEAGRLLKMGGPVTDGRALEVGCGRGLGVPIILRQFGAREVDAFDLDPRMLAKARKNCRPLGDKVRLWLGDATAIAAPDESYDAVFDFEIIHHVPRWRDAVEEIHRVLKPGGRFYAAEVLAHFILHPLWRRVLDHPLEDRFDADTFLGELGRVGLLPITSKTLGRGFLWVVARKAEGHLVESTEFEPASATKPAAEPC